MKKLLTIAALLSLAIAGAMAQNSANDEAGQCVASQVTLIPAKQSK